jgi:hypothetical protein
VESGLSWVAAQTVRTEAATILAHIEVLGDLYGKHLVELWEGKSDYDE